MPTSLGAALDKALTPSLLDRRTTATDLARAFQSLAGGGRSALAAMLLGLRARVPDDEAFAPAEAFPAARLSSIPISSQPATSSLPPVSLQPDSTGEHAAVQISSVDSSSGDSSSGDSSSVDNADKKC